MSNTAEVLLGDTDFCNWGNRYLRQMAEEACVGTWKLLDVMEDSCRKWKLDEPEPSELEWLFACYRTEGCVDIRRTTLERFVEPLRFIYEQHNDLIAPVKVAEPTFSDWASLYIKELWKKVVEPLTINAGLTDWDMMDQFYKAAKAVGQEGIDLHSFPSPLRVAATNVCDDICQSLHPTLKFLHKSVPADKASPLLRRYFNEVVYPICPSQRNEYLQAVMQNAINATSSVLQWKHITDFAACTGPIDITNPELSLFQQPLDYLLGGVNERRMMPASFPVAFPESTPNALDDILICPEEELQVILDPVPIKSKVGTAEFDRAVKKMFTHCLQRGFKWLSAYHVAKAFQIDQRSFEEWADANPYFQCAEGAESGVFFYGLTPLRELRRNQMTLFGRMNGAAMTTDAKPDQGSAPTAVDAVDASAAAAPVVTGSDEFERLATQFLTESKTPWRSSEAIAGALSVDVPELETWMRKSPAFQSRPSAKKDEEKTYFALVTRFEEKQAAATPANHTPTKPVAKDDKKNRKPRSSIRPKELLGFAMMYQILNALIQCLDHYANSFATYHREAFAHITQAQKELSSGVALLKSALKVDDKKLPPPEEL